MPRLAIIAAVAENGCIGINNQLPWYLPEDLKYFRRLTTGGVVIMGRKTYESIGKPLPNRTNIVISRKAGYHPEGIKVVSSLEDALDLAAQVSEINGIDDVFVIGGAQIYAQALPLANRLYLTEVQKTVEGDAFFPPINSVQWREIGNEAHYYEPADTHYRFVVYERTH